MGLLRYLWEFPEAIRSAEWSDDTGWLVSIDIPGQSHRPAFVFRLSIDELITESWHDNPQDRRHRTYEYAESSPPGFGLVNQRGSGASAWRT